MIASSPRYFMDTIPPAEAHYGVEDGIVPRVNGAVLGAAAHAAGRALSLRYHENAGHDQDLFDAPRQTREFFARALGQRAPGEPRD
jgi:hypothetical protein